MYLLSYTEHLPTTYLVIHKAKGTTPLFGWVVALAPNEEQIFKKKYKTYHPVPGYLRLSSVIPNCV